MKKILKIIFIVFLVIFIIMNYAHGFLPQVKAAQPVLSYPKYLDAGTEQHGNSLRVKVFLTLIYPGAFVGRLVHDIINDSGNKPWPRINQEDEDEERKIMVTLLSPDSRVFLYKKHLPTSSTKVFNGN